jgi:hypothetical protein
MKLPWKYLSDLMSRGRRQTERGITGKLIELEAHLARLPQLGSPDVTPVVSTETDDGLQAAKSQRLHHVDSDTEAQPVALADPPVDFVRTRDADAEALLPQERAVPETLEPSVTASDDTAAAALSSSYGFLDDLAGMDEEINQLRRQLSEKLRSQNDQLRMMLKRFDRS